MAENSSPFELSRLKDSIHEEEVKEEIRNPEVKAETTKPPVIYFGHNVESNGIHTNTSKELADATIATPMNIEDTFMRYLKYIQYPFISTLKPVLPLPKQMQENQFAVSQYIEQI